jgi:plasmid stabilization system protein ParE
MVARVRSVDWAVSARAALDDVVTYISQDSHQAAIQVLEKALEVGASLATLAERGRVVPESNDPTIREVFVFRYRLMYEVREDRVLILAFVHGARDFGALQKNES